MDESFGEQTRDVAVRAASWMNQLEKQDIGSTAGIIKKFRYLIPEEDEW